MVATTFAADTPLAVTRWPGTVSLVTDGGTAINGMLTVFLFARLAPGTNMTDGTGGTALPGKTAAVCAFALLFRPVHECHRHGLGTRPWKIFKVVIGKWILSCW
jgi:hypothetical protein